MILAAGQRITPSAISLPVASLAGTQASELFSVMVPRDKTFNDILKAVKHDLIREALRRSQGSRTAAASMLGLFRDALKHHMKSLGIE